MLAAALLVGCAPRGPVAWGSDPIWLAQADEGGVYGFQTWRLYRDGWQRKQRDRFYACAVLVELSGDPTEPCDGCSHAFGVSAAVIESDCLEGMQDDARFTGLTALALGQLGSTADSPYPSQSYDSHADYGYGWEPHGLAWPADLDHGAILTDPSWEAGHAFHFEPLTALPL